MSSMMAPTITRQVNGALLATVSNGSRQIRKAIVQLLINVIGYGMDKESAIQATCVYVEDSGICIEGGLPDRVIETVTPHYHGIRRLGRALSFGWIHSVIVRGAGLLSFGDSNHGGTNNMSAVVRC